MNDHNIDKLTEPTMEMTAANVCALYDLLGGKGIEIWVDGGWGVDALLEEQTRTHNDLDIAIQESDLESMRAVLGPLGFSDKGEEDARPWNFILRNDAGHEIDVHAVNLDAQGNGIYGPPENGEMYPASALTGVGRISGMTVRCIGAEDMVKFHSGYELKAKDYHDVSALCEKFGMPLPEEYSKFVE